MSMVKIEGASEKIEGASGKNGDDPFCSGIASPDLSRVVVGSSTIEESPPSMRLQFAKQSARVIPGEHKLNEILMGLTTEPVLSGGLAPVEAARVEGNINTTLAAQCSR
eukprot:1322541-Amorphochlora_amoeboformis.AAC.2